MEIICYGDCSTGCVYQDSNGNCTINCKKATDIDITDLEKTIQWLEKAIENAKETDGILIDIQSAINLLGVLKELC